MKFLKEVKLFYIAIILFLFVSCQQPTEPVNPVSKPPYMTLSIGDIRQYYNEIEKIYTLWECIDTAKRADDQKVYVFNYGIYTSDGVYSALGYHFIRDGYFWDTALDTVFNPEFNDSNPFMESKIISIYPVDGEFFLRTEGVADNKKIFHKISIFDSLETPVKTFKDVLQCELIDSDTTRNVWILYAPEYGHIGTYIWIPRGINKIYINYAKIGSKEIGNYIPLTPKNKIRLDSKKINFAEYFLW